MNISRIAGQLARLTRQVSAQFILFADRLTLYGWTYASRSALEHAWTFFCKLLESAGIEFKPHPRLLDGVLFIGYAEGTLGLGQAFRADLGAAEAAGLKFAIFPFRSGIRTRITSPHMPHRYEVKRAYAFNLIEVSADQIPEVFRIVPRKLFSNSYNILRTYWELPAAPQEWRPFLSDIHEIWAPNQFIADAFSHVFDGPIITIAPAVEDAFKEKKLIECKFDRTHFGLEVGRFYFIYSFDYYSSPFRKNPIGVLQAFLAAFPLGTENVGLILKSTGKPDHFPEIKAEIAAAAALDTRIKVIDQPMTRAEVLCLIRAADAFFSLHRAEGFGLGMVEAMMFEKVVIGTDYSGSTDFLTPMTGYPVPYTLRSVLADEYSWSSGQSWAEPDLDAAAKTLRHVVEFPEEGRERARHARTHVLQRYDVHLVGQQMAGRLNALKASIGQHTFT